MNEKVGDSFDCEDIEGIAPFPCKRGDGTGGAEKIPRIGGCDVQGEGCGDGKERHLNAFEKIVGFRQLLANRRAKKIADTFRFCVDSAKELHGDEMPHDSHSNKLLVYCNHTFHSWAMKNGWRPTIFPNGIWIEMEKVGPATVRFARLLCASLRKKGIEAWYE